MTSWNTTPFSTFAIKSDPDAGTTGEQPFVGDDVQSLPLPQPSRPGPLGFVDVRVQASAAADETGDAVDERVEVSQAGAEPVAEEPEPQPQLEPIVFDEPAPAPPAPAQTYAAAAPPPPAQNQ